MPRYDRFRDPKASQDNSHANIVLPGEGRVIELGPLRLTVKEAGERTRGTLALVELEASTTFHSPPPHIHRAHEEGFYVLDGELEITTGGKKVRAKPGTFVMVPIGVPHTFGNATREPVRFLCTISPYHYVRYFEEVAPLFAAGAPDARAVGAIMARYATEVVGLG
jgi:mannose-6-phosphate isomerase-like protein (cupin superfamily)